MNNCPKCGNPLQEGANSCPICGTNILETKQEEVKSVAQPVQPAQPAPVAPAPVAAPAPAPAEVAPVQPVQPVAPAPAQPVAAVPETPAQPVAPAAPVAPEEVTPASIAPTVERVESNTPIPGIPSSVTEQSVAINQEQPPMEGIKPAKKKNKKTLLVVLLVAVVAMGAVAAMTMFPSNKAKPNNNAVPNETVAKFDMASNGYYLKLAEGWQVTEDGTNVLISNSESTVIIRLDHTNKNLDNIDANGVENIMKSVEYYKEVDVAQISMSGRNSYLVNTSINELPVQVYLINGGSTLMLGATVIYQSNDTKTKYEAAITEMIGTLSYSEDSIKAIETMSEYSTIFNIFGSISNQITNKPVEQQPEQPAPEEPEPEENEPEEAENQQPEENQENNEQPAEQE